MAIKHKSWIKNKDDNQESYCQTQISPSSSCGLNRVMDEELLEKRWLKILSKSISRMSLEYLDGKKNKKQKSAVVTYIEKKIWSFFL